MTIIKDKLVTMANLETRDYDVSNVLSLRDLVLRLDCKTRFSTTLYCRYVVMLYSPIFIALVLTT